MALGIVLIAVAVALPLAIIVFFLNGILPAVGAYFSISALVTIFVIINLIERELTPTKTKRKK